MLIGESTPQAAFQVAYVVEMARASPNERAAAALEADLLERVVAAAACQGLTAEQVREEPVWRLVPRLVLMAANTAKAENEQRAQGALPLDAELARLAVAAGKLTAWIESPRQQIDLFRGMAQDDLIGMLREVARRPDCPRDDAGDRILELYRARDLDGMTALEGEWLAAVEDPALWRRFARRLGADRNHRMADRIEEFAQATSVFVAVGAGHLPGSEGLIALLQARGWTVTPIE